MVSGRLLALDVGESKVGIAYSDELGKIAFPGQRLSRTAKDFWQQLSKICQDLKVVKIVIGWPLTLAGKEAEQVTRVRIFRDQLAEKINLPTAIWDERFTSKQARDLVKGLSARHKPDEDSLAAYLILQAYLASLPS